VRFFRLLLQFGFVAPCALILVACGGSTSTAAADPAGEDASVNVESGDPRADGREEPSGSTMMDANSENAEEGQAEPDSPDRDGSPEGSATNDAEADRDAGVVDETAEPDADVSDAPDGAEAGLPHHIGGSCTSDANCIYPLTCDLTVPYGRCTRTCVDDVDCGPGNICASDGTCYRRCIIDADCLRTSFHCAGGVAPATFCISEFQRDL